LVVIDRDKCKNMFCRKGFETEELKNHTNLYFKSEGKRTPFKTHMSRGGHGKKIDDYLIEKMAIQLKLTRDEFMGFYDCTFEKKDYIRFVKEKLGPDPLDLL